jgi:hypothetical protein
MLAAKTAWLDAPLRWRDGRVAWGEVAPGPAELSAAQRAINQLARYPVVVARVFGDAEAFVGRRRARLGLAKRLARVREADLEALAREGDAEGRRRLADALVAEALAVDRPSFAPSAALVACAAGDEVRAVAADASLPDEARALAALVLGARRDDGAIASLDSAWRRRAFALGRRRGLPAEPSLAVRLLAAPDGETLVRRCDVALASGGPFQLAPAALCELLARGAPPDKIVALAEALAEAAPLAGRILEHRSALPDPATQECRKAAAQHLLAEHEEALGVVAEALRASAAESREPEVVRAAAAFAHRVVDLRLLAIVPLGRAIAAALGEGRKLAPPLHLAFLRLLVERHTAIWDPASVPMGRRASKIAGRLQHWLEDRHGRFVRPIRILLERTADAGLVAEAVERGVQAALATRAWPEPGMYRIAMDLLRLIDENPGVYKTEQVCDAVGSYPSSAAARAALRDLVHPLEEAPAETRESVLLALIERPEYGGPPRRIALGRAARHVPQLVRYAASTTERFRLYDLVPALLALERLAPDRAVAWFGVVVDRVMGLEKIDPDGIRDATIAPAARLAALLSRGDDARFERIFRMVLGRASEDRSPWIANGTAALEGRAAACEAMAGVFFEQTHRAMALLVRLGLAHRLGPDALAPLAALEPRDDEPAPASEDWDHCLALLPALGDEAAACRRARRVLGAPDTLPAGVRRAIERPARLAGELDYVEGLLARSPSRADLAARAASLRARLADGGRLQRAVEADAAERLARATVEARMAALERQVLECFRLRLASIVGVLPEGLAFDDDLLNAIVMCSHVAVNRKLLLDLVRAHVWGDAAWRERHPANAAFLQSIAERGVDVEAWLGAHPRAYPCDGVAGGRVRLAFERDPLRVLQMGNYFGTCLSAGEFNAFSAVANACELNKRVLYAMDATGRVLGRKLVVLNERGALLGFHTYVCAHDRAVNAAIEEACHRHVVAFAARCGLELANDGTSPRLFADGWYDDGVVEWSEAGPGAATPRGPEPLRGGSRDRGSPRSETP